MGEEFQNEKMNKNQRVLDMYVRLCEGKILNKTEEAQKFGVDERSIQRDIDDIRAFLDERSIISIRRLTHNNEECDSASLIYTT